MPTSAEMEAQVSSTAHGKSVLPMSMTQARGIVGDLFRPKPWVYWTDFLVTWAIGTACFAVVRLFPLFSWQQALVFTVSCLAYYRVAMFIHELVHLRKGTFQAFRFVWNMLVGIPFLLPSFLYYTHVDHHRRKHYGTERDGEYLPLAHRSRWHIVVYMLGILVIPVLPAIRFGILSPLAWIFPPIRRWVHQHASSMVMDPSYIRPLPSERSLRTIYIQEALCFLWLVGVFAVPLIFLDRWPIPFLTQVYFTALVGVALNQIRTLGAHRWYNDHGEMTFLEQLQDSVNYPHRPWVTLLWGPIGLRYHALHHLFPSIPYHSLHEAHHRLMDRLPANSPYRSTNAVSLLGVLSELWTRPRSGAKQA